MTDRPEAAAADPLAIPAGALRTVWLFRVGLPDAALPAFEARPDPAAANGAAPAWPLRDALGVPDLDPDRVEVFKPAALGDYALSRYLIEANGMDAGSVGPDAAMLDALTGPILLLHASALPAEIGRLDPRPPLDLIGRYTESLDFSLRAAPTSAAAAGPTIPAPRKAPSAAAQSGRVATVALLVLFALVGLMIWVAG